jgi:MFS family permease
MLFNVLVWFRPYMVLAIIYFAQITHSYALAISVFAVVQIAQAVFELPTGMYSDIVGRRRCLILSAVASAISVICYARATTYTLLLVGALCEGAFLALINGNNEALLYETLVEADKEESYATTLGKVSSNAQLAGFIAGVTGSVIAMRSFPLLLWLSVVPQVLCVAISFRVVEPPVHRFHVDNPYSHLKEALDLLWHNAKLRRMSTASILSYGIGAPPFRFQVTFYALFWPAWVAGLMLSSNFLISTVSYRLSGRIIKKLTAIKLLVVREVYSRVLWFIALLFPSPLSPALCSASSIFYGPGEVALNTLMQEQFTDRQRATLASLNATVGNILYAVTAVLLGLLADKVGPTVTLLVVQIALLPASWLYWQTFACDRMARVHAIR